MAMDLRAGHYPSDWKKTYYKADEVGDFHIGRQVGIGRVGHPDGTVLPAHFKDPAHPEVIAIFELLNITCEHYNYYNEKK